MKNATEKATKKTTTAPDETLPAETREDKLKRLGMARVKKACNTIRLVGNLAAYKPTDEQIDAIMEQLGSSCAAIDARMRGTKRTEVNFTL